MNDGRVEIMEVCMRSRRTRGRPPRGGPGEAHQARPRSCSLQTPQPPDAYYVVRTPPKQIPKLVTGNLVALKLLLSRAGMEIQMLCS